ncbi:unnamed protein product [Timema podura]|uniref:Uncharacterized protein n=1 Tax=Timema podura TaxID=61482 RepID=A0ABN7NID1_TIMPD|nr:unnamed protein product [Timema podura]
MPVKHCNQYSKNSAWLLVFVSIVTKTMSRARTGCIGILRNYSDKSTLGHVLRPQPVLKPIIEVDIVQKFRVD